MTSYRRILLPLCLATLIGGCGTTPSSNYYLLSANNGPPGHADAQRLINIGLGPVEFPAYLDRNQIVISTGTNSLRTAEYHRWAEPLADNFTRVLTQNLTTELPQAHLHAYPWHPVTEPDMHLNIKVLRFDVNNRNQAHLRVSWELADTQRKPLAPRQSREYAILATSADYETRVNALSRCVAALSHDLAASIRAAMPSTSQ